MRIAAHGEPIRRTEAITEAAATSTSTRRSAEASMMGCPMILLVVAAALPAASSDTLRQWQRAEAVDGGALLTLPPELVAAWVVDANVRALCVSAVGAGATGAVSCVDIISDPGTQPLRFLCIAYGLAWSEVTASNLLLLDETGKVLEGSGAPDPTAFFIHSRIHKQHPHATCVLHTHMPHATALCCLEDMELKMINQNCLRFYDEVAYDTDYKGLVLGTVEGDRMARAMGSHRVLMHRNHGVITTGDSVAEAFDELYYLERCAQVQCLAYATGRPLATVSKEICVEYKKDVVKYRGCWAEKHFGARKRELLKGGAADFAA